MTEIVITLLDSEQRIAHFLAREREANARKDDVTDRKVGPQDKRTTDLDGIGAELAFCKLHNIYPDLGTSTYGDYDAVLHTGERVDVKATRYPYGHLITIYTKAHKPKEHRPELYALMVGEFPTWRYAGLMTESEFLRLKRLKDFGYGPTYAAKQQELVLVEPEDE